PLAALRLDLASDRLEQEGRNVLAEADHGRLVTALASILTRPAVSLAERRPAVGPDCIGARCFGTSCLGTWRFRTTRFGPGRCRAGRPATRRRGLRFCGS